MKMDLLTSWRQAQMAAVVLGLALPAYVSAAAEQTFASPEAAVNALVSAARNHDTNALHSIFGPEGHDLISPDAVQATEGFRLFVQRLTGKTQLINHSDSNVTLEIGVDSWPFPIPLVKQDGQWFFDTVAGKEEILNRRIGMDEIGAINVCNAYVDAQREYASLDRIGDGVFAYAQFLRSMPGTHDGLFWPAKPGEELSPLGPLVAEARVEGYHRTAKLLNDEQAPYHGYYFKILTRTRRQVWLHHQLPYDCRICPRRVAGRMGQHGRDDIHRQSTRQGLSKEPRIQDRENCQGHHHL